MRLRLAIIVCVMAALSSNSSAIEKQLRPAGYAGLIYRDIKSGDVASLKLSDQTGLVVSKIFPGSPAEKANLKVGDVLKKYDQTDIPDSARFITVLRSYHAGDKIKVSLLRNGATLLTELVLEPFPRETADDCDIEYVSFPSGDIALRAVITSPLGSKGKKLPALLLVSALNSPRFVGVPYYSMSRSLAISAAKRGFRVLRFELRGHGDSEGEDYRTQDFNTEVNDNLAALDFLQNNPGVDDKKVFVFGHSTGGQIAAILAGRRKIAGLVTSSTIGRTMHERSLETLRLQNEFAGSPQPEIDRKLKGYMDLLVSITRGEAVGSIIKRNPAIAGFVNNENRIMDDRTPEYWKQQLELNLPEIYWGVKAPVLIIHGTSDFLTMPACHANIRKVLEAAGNRDVTSAEIPDLDHRYAFAKSMRESFENYKTNNFKENPAAVKIITDWLAGHAEK